MVLPSGHALAARVRVPLTALAGLPYIHFPRAQAPGLYDRINALCLAAGFSPRVAMEADHTQACLALVAGGLGVALLPASAEQVRRDGVVFRPLTPRVIVRTPMVYRRERPPVLLANLLAVVRGSDRSGGCAGRASRSGRSADDGGQGMRCRRLAGVVCRRCLRFPPGAG